MQLLFSLSVYSFLWKLSSLENGGKCMVLAFSWRKRNFLQEKNTLEKRCSSHGQGFGGNGW